MINDIYRIEWTTFTNKQMLNNFITILNKIEITDDDNFNKIVNNAIKNAMNNNTKYYHTKKNANICKKQMVKKEEIWAEAWNLAPLLFANIYRHLVKWFFYVCYVCEVLVVYKIFFEGKSFSFQLPLLDDFFK
jgi:hypothetical protein